MVNILLWAFESFNTIYNSVYIQYNTIQHSCKFSYPIYFAISCLKSMQFIINHFHISYYFTINFETMKKECRTNFHKFETSERFKKKNSKMLLLFDSYPRNPVLGSSFLVTNPKSITNMSQLKNNPRKKNQMCILGFLVKVVVYPILLRLQNFLGTHEPYFSHASFNKMMAL